MNYKELKNLPAKELQKILTQTQDKLRDFKFKVASNQVKNIRELREAKKTIARILFLLKQPAEVARTESLQNKIFKQK